MEPETSVIEYSAWQPVRINAGSGASDPKGTNGGMYESLDACQADKPSCEALALQEAAANYAYDTCRLLHQQHRPPMDTKRRREARRSEQLFRRLAHLRLVARGAAALLPHTLLR